MLKAINSALCCDGGTLRRAIVVALFVASLWPSVAMSVEAGPFGPFLGSWRGGGKVFASDGHSEHISCRATYTGSGERSSLSQSLVCASDSYRFDIQSYAETTEGALRGNWQETTRNAEGQLSGMLYRGDFEGTVSGPGFTAQISIRSNGRRQVVDIRPSAGGITAIQVSLSR